MIYPQDLDEYRKSWTKDALRQLLKIDGVAKAIGKKANALADSLVKH